MNRFLAFIFIVAGLFFASSADAATIKQPPSGSGLFAYWSFNEATSTVLSDLSGNGRHGTLNTFANPPTVSSGWGTGRFASGLVFDGSSDYVSIPDSDSWAFGSNDFTMSVWVKFKDLSGQAGTGQMFISQDQSGGTAPKWMFGYPGATSGAPAGNQNKLSFHINDTGQVNGYWVSGNAWTPTLGQWYHLVVTRSGSTFTFYRDGIADGSGTISYAIPNAAIDVRLGQAEGLFYFNGSMDEFRIFTRALSALEISQLYRSGQTKFATSKPVISNGLIGWWTFDGKDMFGGVARDQSGNARHGSLINISTSTFYSQGAVGQGVVFDGVNDYVNIGAVGITGTQAMSVSGWVRRTDDVRGKVIGIDDTGAGGAYAWLLTMNGQGCGGAAVTSAGAFVFCPARQGFANFSYSTPASYVPLNQWTHIALAWNGSSGSGNAQLYVNGSSTPVTYASEGTFGSPTSNDAVKIGSANTASMKGGYDDFRIYNRTLSATEVRMLAGANTDKFVTPNNSGLVGYWSFNEGTSTKATDFSNNGNVGTLTNMSFPASATSGWNVGRIGKGLNFDGTDDYVDMGDVLDMGTGSMTVAAWFKTTDQNASIVNKSRLGAVSGRYALVINGGNFNAIFEGLAAITVSASAAPYLDNRWHHAAVTFNRTGSMTLYVDAVSLGSADISASSAVNMNSSCNLYIGIYNGATCTTPTGGFEMNGSIDEVRIYNRVLSATEIASLYRAK